MALRAAHSISIDNYYFVARPWTAVPIEFSNSFNADPILKYTL